MRDRLQMVIEAAGRERPEGAFTLEGAEPVAFSGWLELLRLIEAALEPRPAEADDG